MTNWRQHPFLSIGFRPFYLGAAVFAALAVPLWVYSLLSGMTLTPFQSGHQWHIHEMLFGFVPAVISGFLLTAVRNWTGLPTVSGAGLGLLVILWLLGRALPFAGYPYVSATVDLAFLPSVIGCLTIPLWRSRNTRNAFVIPVLLVLWLGNLTFYAGTFEIVGATLMSIVNAVSLDIILLLLTVIGGRVIPNFSANAIRSLRPKRWSGVESLTIVLAVLVVAIDAAGPWLAPMPGFEFVLGLAAMAHLVRLVGWKPWRTYTDVLLFVLPLSYLWIPCHLILRAVFDPTPGAIHPIAAHALFVGGMAGLMLSMMTRSARGHTGRPLRADWPDCLCFLSVHLAALIRVIGPWIAPSLYGPSLISSAALWSVAFSIFAIFYSPILTTERVQPPTSGPARLPAINIRQVDI